MSTGNGAQPLLRMRGITKVFGPVQALTDVDLDVRAGEVTALLGDNGAGKSVLIKCVAGIHSPEHGEIFWEGEPVRIRSPRDAAHLGIETVYQDLALCNNLDIVQNMFLGRERHNGLILDEEAMEKAAQETLTSLAVTTVRSIRQPVASLSGGQRQSVAIAKSVLWNAKLVIMDEPTAALGVAQTAMVLDLVRRLADRGHAALIISHNMNDVFEVADRIAVLYLGRMAAIRPAAELDRQLAVELMTTGTSSRLTPRRRLPAGRADTVSKIDEPTPGRPAPPSEELSDVAARQAELAVPAELVAGSATEYLKSSVSRLKAGEAGILPVVGGLILISILFQSLNSNFLTAQNLVNLLVQAAVFALLGMGEVFVLLLGEIDLSIGYVAAIGGVTMADLAGPGYGWPWWAAIAAALIVCAAIGTIQGMIITQIGLPSFVVTLAGLLFWQGVMLRILGNGGTIPINDTIINDIASNNLSNIAGWVVMLVIVGLFGVMSWRRDAKRRHAGLVAPPPSVTLLKIAGSLVCGVALVLLCNTNRGILQPISGVPWVVLLVLGVLGLWSFLLGRTQLGRFIYAIGGSAEAARRAGVNLSGIRTTAFMLTSLTAGVAGVVYASRLRSISTTVDGGTLVLYAVAAAVIGGTSLMGGRGKAVHGVLGGIVIAAIDNGMGLLGFTAASKYIVTALVLLAAVTIDALSRRGRVAGL